MAEIRCLNAQVNEGLQPTMAIASMLFGRCRITRLTSPVYSPPFSGLYIYNDSRGRHGELRG